MKKIYLNKLTPEEIGKMEIIAEYPTWQDAVNSKEFKVGGK